jgi:Thymidylate synthase
MRQLSPHNVRDGLPIGLDLILTHGEEQPSRNGAVLSMGPVAVTYANSKQHVLLNPVRDANPFFHLIEALWMLAGRRDGAPLDFYIKHFTRDYGHKGLIPDAYGHRWREHFGDDQLTEVIRILRKTPNTRQAVLQMWDPAADLWGKVAEPCNMSVVFRVRSGRLDMTVMNRSNDILFGLFGANAVQFGLLHEYVGAMTGIPTGVYCQFANDYHLYLSAWERYRPHINNVIIDMSSPGAYPVPLALVGTPELFNEELKWLWLALDILHKVGPPAMTCDHFLSEANPFLQGAYFMAVTYAYHKEGNQEGARYALAKVPMADWKQAAGEWLERRWTTAK